MTCHTSGQPDDIRDELGLIDGCICEPAVLGSYSGTVLPGCPHHEALRRVEVERAFERVLERHSEAFDRLTDL